MEVGGVALSSGRYAANPPERFGVIVAGAGPAGLFCAQSIRNREGGVLLLERNPGPGAKLLLSGSGQCNFTHTGSVQDLTCRYGRAGNFVKPALHAFSNSDLVAFIESLGVPTAVRDDGKVFPASMRASDVLAALQGRCRERGVRIICGSRVTSVSHDVSGFTVTAEGREFLSRALVLSTGGCSHPETGSTGDGYAVAGSLGHTIVEVTEALAPVGVSDPLIRGLAGISVRDATVRLVRDGRRTFAVTGDVLFTGSGLSGPGILDLSRYIREGDVLWVSMTGTDPDQLAERLSEEFEGGRTPVNVLRNLGIPARLSRVILQSGGIPPSVRAAELPGTLRRKVLELVTAFPVRVARKGGFSVAMATAGGVRRDEINRHTMESRILRNLFFAGEIMDVDGDTGGYNIQWAFSSACAAALGASETTV